MSLLPAGHWRSFSLYLKLQHCRAKHCGLDTWLHTGEPDLGCDLLLQNLLQARTKKPGLDLNVLV